MMYNKIKWFGRHRREVLDLGAKIQSQLVNLSIYLRLLEQRMRWFQLRQEKYNKSPPIHCWSTPPFNPSFSSLHYLTQEHSHLLKLNFSVKYCNILQQVMPKMSHLFQLYHGICPLFWVSRCCRKWTWFFSHSTISVLKMSYSSFHRENFHFAAFVKWIVYIGCNIFTG